MSPETEARLVNDHLRSNLKRIRDLAADLNRIKKETAKNTNAKNKIKGKTEFYKNCYGRIIGDIHISVVKEFEYLYDQIERVTKGMDNG